MLKYLKVAVLFKKKCILPKIYFWIALWLQPKLTASNLNSTLKVIWIKLSSFEPNHAASEKRSHQDVIKVIPLPYEFAKKRPDQPFLGRWHCLSASIKDTQSCFDCWPNFCKHVRWHCENNFLTFILAISWNINYLLFLSSMPDRKKKQKKNGRLFNQKSLNIPAAYNKF